MAASPSAPHRHLSRPSQTSIKSFPSSSQLRQQSQAQPTRPSQQLAKPPDMPSTIESIMTQASKGVDVTHRLAEIKEAILLDGIEADENGMSSHRIYVWLVLLEAPFTRYADYESLVHRGASPVYTKIKDDVHRTLASDHNFTRRVSQNSISRLLNAMAWTINDEIRDIDKETLMLANLTPLPPEEGLPSAHLAHSPEHDLAASEAAAASGEVSIPAIGGGEASTPLAVAAAPEASALPLPQSPKLRPSDLKPAMYVQGMNVLAAPLMYVARSEPQAFTLFKTLLRRELPTYITPTMAGVHAGLALLDRLLSFLDPFLYNHLAVRGLHASTYAFSSIVTLSACTPPLPEALKLWDFLFAYGVHLNVLAVIAQLIMMRKKLLDSDTPGSTLRMLPPLNAKRIIETVLAFVKRLDDTMYTELVEHTGGNDE